MLNLSKKKSWKKQSRKALKKTFSKIYKETKIKEHSVINKFRTMLKKNPVERMYMYQMIKEIPDELPYKTQKIRDIEHLFSLINKVLVTAPDFNTTLLVGTPLSAILIWTMGTKTGFFAYRNKKINDMFKDILSVWQKFLNSKESLYVLNSGKNGWMSDKAQKKINIEDYQYKKNEPYWGFKSWNDFFTRKLAAGKRPIASPDNNKIIVSGCDCTIYRIRYNVKKISKFWLKTQPYSLIDMLDNDEEFANIFEGGSVFQAFLNPFNYHRWHSPVSGIIVKAHVINGLYFSQDDFKGEDPTDQDRSQAYLSEIQTRAIIIIKSDNSKLGYVCMMPIGMVEISSCIINDYVKVGYNIKKGEELGYFQFGGSTHCVIFQNNVNFIKKKRVVKMGEAIASV